MFPERFQRLLERMTQEFPDLPEPEAVARLQKLCHDLLAVQVGAAPRFFDAADLPHQPLPLLALTMWRRESGLRRMPSTN